jgi:hypothetical protein
MRCPATPGDWQSQYPAGRRQGLVKAGIPEHVARGAAAGVVAESGNREGAVNRRRARPASASGSARASKALIDRYGPNPTRAQQIEFLAYELKGGDAGGKSVLAAKDEDEALRRYITDFMRPAAGQGDDRRPRTRPCGAWEPPWDAGRPVRRPRAHRHGDGRSARRGGARAMTRTPTRKTCRAPPKPCSTARRRTTTSTSSITVSSSASLLGTTVSKDEAPPMPGPCSKRFAPDEAKRADRGASRPGRGADRGAEGSRQLQEGPHQPARPRHHHRDAEGWDSLGHRA